MPSRYARLLNDRPFLQLLVTGGGSFAAPTASLVILLWSIPHAYAGQPNRETYGAIALAFLGLSSTIPTLAAALVSGTLADRIDRRRLMIVVNLVSLLATLGIALDFARQPGGIVTIPGVPGFYLPVWILAIYPLWALETVGRSDLGVANGLVYAAALLLSVGGSLASSGSIEFIGPGLAFLVPIVLFASTQVALITLRGNFAPSPDRPRRRFLSDAAAGYRYLWEKKALLELTLSAVAINFLSAIAFVELGLYVTFWLGLSNALFVGLMISGGSLGAAVGTLAVGRLGFERRAGRFLVVLTALQGVTVLILGLVRTPWAAIPDMFMFGVFPGMFTTVFFATVQATVPVDRLGRVLAADEVGSFSM
ncbi:MAG: MFS transporter, partial [Thermoplasmata archaeon]|nr:MFS transporter [Thermoplasmata archaeon]